MFREGVQLEIAYAKDLLPNGLMGLTHQMMEQYIMHIADRRMEKLNLTKQYGKTENPFPWMSEVIDLRKEKNCQHLPEDEYHF